MSINCIRVLTTDDAEMLFQAAPSDLGPVIQRIQSNKPHPVDENLNPAVPTWFGYGDGFSYPLRDDGDLVRTIHELFEGLPHHTLRQVEAVSEIADIT